VLANLAKVIRPAAIVRENREMERNNEEKNLPLLHTVETLKGWDGDKDDNSLLAVADFNLCTIKSQHASSI
jgi:hypothetical protein